jgi:MFS family permease
MKLFSKRELKLLWPFYLDALLSPIFFFAPAFMILHFRDLGFSMFQVGLLISAMPLIMLLFEIPTGAIADIYGRKFSVLLGTALEGLGFLSLFFLKDFYPIATAFAFIGFGATFSSGAGEAWVTDLIKIENKNLLKSFMLKSQWLDSSGLLLSGVIGALFVKSFGLPIIWLVGGASYILSLIILSTAKENFKKKKETFKEAIFDVEKQSKISLNYTTHHRTLLYILIASAILIFAGNMSSLISWVPFLEDLGLEDHQFGYLWSLISLAGIAAPIVTNKIYKVGKEKQLIISMISISVVLTLSVLLVNSLAFGIAIFIGLIFFAFIKMPAKRIYFQEFTPTKLRATIGSVEGMLMSIIALIAVPLAGYLVDIIGPRYTIALSGVLMIPAIFVYISIKDKKIKPK